MLNIILKLRKGAIIFACLAVTLAMIFLVASCQKDEPTYTVRFDSKDGTPTPQEQTVNKGGKVTKPADPTRENYILVGWTKTDNETSALWDFETETVTGDMTLFARWSIYTYLVTFDSDGGSTVPAQTVAHGGTVTKPADPTRNGYQFDGWFPYDLDDWFYDGKSWNFATVITAPFTLKAHWGATYTVTFDSNGGSAVASQTVAEGRNATEPLPVPTKEGYTFVGWYEDNSTFNIKWGFAIKTVTADITLFAKWMEGSGGYDGVKLLDTETRGFHMRKFFYDEQNRIKETWRYSGRLMEKNILTYVGEDLTKIEYVYFDEKGEIAGVSTRNFVKDGNTICYSSELGFIDEEEEKEESTSMITTLTLNDDGFPEKVVDSLLGMDWVLYYTYVNGNLTNLLSVGFDGETMEFNFTYGDYRSAYSGCNTPKWVRMFLHGFSNISHNAASKYENESIDYSGFKSVELVTYEYEYSYDRFPTICILKSREENHSYVNQIIITEFKYKD